LGDVSILPEKTYSTTNIMNYFKIRTLAVYDALTDAIDMANIYLKMVQLIKKQFSISNTN